MVNRRDKGKHKVTNLQPKPKDVVSPGGPQIDDNMFSALSQVNELSEQVVTGSETANHLEVPLRASISSHANLGSISYIYDTKASDCSGNPTVVEFHEVEETNGESDESKEVEVEEAFVRPISARQRKKEAKMLFSGSRPKGRH